MAANPELENALKNAMPMMFNKYEEFDADAAMRRAHGKRPREEGDENSDEERQPDVSGLEIPKVRQMLKNPLEEMKPRTEFRSDEEYIANWVCYALGVWRKCVSAEDEDSKIHKTPELREFYCDKRNFHKSEKTMTVLLKQCQRKDIPAENLHKTLMAIVDLAMKRDYAGCNKAFIDLTVGKVKWHMDVCHGEARHNKGYNFRKLYRDPGLRVLDDEGVKAYLQGIRRLLILLQSYFPSDDLSRHI